MARRRYYDPLGVSDEPTEETDPGRIAEIEAEMDRKIAHIERAYRFEKKTQLDIRSFNAWVDRLRNAIGRQGQEDATEERVHPLLETAINIEARKLAGLPETARLEAEHIGFVAQATSNVVSRTKKMRGSPGQILLRRYVIGAMAVIQEATGRPFLAQRYKDSVYEPMLPGPQGQKMREIVDRLEPGVSDSRLRYWVDEARKKYAGKPMRFRDMFPDYGLRLDPDAGMPVSTAYSNNVTFTPNNAIYCP